MASLVNPYFHPTVNIEQSLFNSIKTESIKVMGRTYYYLPRNLQVKNLILGEDALSSFSLAIPIEMYMEQSTGFEGDKEMFSKFGLQVQNSYTLVVSKDRWEAEVQTQFDGEVGNGEANFDRENNFRPLEGDLVYDPMTKFLMEIKFTDHDADFYQAGTNYLYHLSCEAFQYGSETIDTGVAEIDIFSDKGNDLLEWQLLTEAGDILLFDNAQSTVILDVAVSPTHHTVQGTDFVTPAKGKVIVQDPFA